MSISDDTKQKIITLLGEDNQLGVEVDTLSNIIDLLVDDALKRKSSVMQVNLAVSDTIDTDGLIKLMDQYETFVPKVSERKPSYLDSKVGFKFKIEKESSDFATSYLAGNADQWTKTLYNFEVKNSSNGAYANFGINMLDGGFKTVYSISIDDQEYNGVPDRVYVQDGINNTEVSIYRSHTGELEYQGIDQEGAKVLFGTMMYKYQEFRALNLIDALLDSYTPKFELVEDDDLLASKDDIIN